MKTYALKTFGCQMNHSDSERVAGVLEQCGFRLVPEGSDSAPDLIIVNTCSVRQKSEDKALGFMRNQKKKHPESLLAVTGCMVRQTGDKASSKDKLLLNPSIDMVFRIEDAGRLPKMLERRFTDHDFSSYAGVFGTGEVENYFQIHPKITASFQAYVSIMQGCDKFCTYCIVPYTRGREISRPMHDVVAECERHVEAGAKEIYLLGQNVNSYKDGEKGEKCFAKLLRAVDELYDKGLRRLRFTSAHPQDFTDDVIDALATMKAACPYVHLPVQHGSNRVLRLMNRNYTIEKFEGIIQKLRERIPETTLATDIIVGFPGETEADFQELLAFAKRVKLDFSYTAIFSPRKNTPAARMESDFIDDKTKRERFHRFDQVIKKYAWAHRQEYVGKVLEVLVDKSVEENGVYKCSGRTPEFFELWFESPRPMTGKLVPVRVTEARGYVLHGEMTEAVPARVGTGLRVVAG